MHCTASRIEWILNFSNAVLCEWTLVGMVRVQCGACDQYFNMCNDKIQTYTTIFWRLHPLIILYYVCCAIGLERTTNCVNSM